MRSFTKRPFALILIVVLAEKKLIHRSVQVSCKRKIVGRNQPVLPHSDTAVATAIYVAAKLPWYAPADLEQIWLDVGKAIWNDKLDLESGQRASGITDRTRFKHQKHAAD